MRRAPVAHKTNRGCGWLRASLRWTSLRGIDGYLDAATSLGPICVSPAVPRHTGGVRPRNRRAAWCWRDGTSLHRRPSPANWRKVIRGLSGQLPATDQWATGADGIRDAGTHVVSMAGSCPKTQMVLGGFSQGAAVMGFVTSAAVPDGSILRPYLNRCNPKWPLTSPRRALWTAKHPRHGLPRRAANRDRPAV